MYFARHVSLVFTYILCFQLCLANLYSANANAETNANVDVLLKDLKSFKAKLDANTNFEDKLKTVETWKQKLRSYPKKSGDKSYFLFLFGLNAAFALVDSDMDTFVVDACAGTYRSRIFLEFGPQSANIDELQIWAQEALYTIKSLCSHHPQD